MGSHDLILHFGFLPNVWRGVFVVKECFFFFSFITVYLYLYSYVLIFLKNKNPARSVSFLCWTRNVVWINYILSYYLAPRSNYYIRKPILHNIITHIILLCVRVYSVICAFRILIKIFKCFLCYTQVKTLKKYLYRHQLL